MALFRKETRDFFEGMLLLDKKKEQERADTDRTRNEQNYMQFINFLYEKITKVSREKEKIIKDIEEVRNMDVVQAILDFFIDDAMAKDFASKKILSIEIKGEKKDKRTAALKFFNKKYDLEAITLNIVEDLLLFGEQFLSIETKEKEGVVGVHDTLDLDKVIPVYENMVLTDIWVLEETKWVKKKKDSVVPFILSPRRVKIKLPKDIFKEKSVLKDKFGKGFTVRWGRSLIYPALEKLKNLKFLENADFAETTKNLLRPEILGVTVPQATDLDDTFEIVKKYESMVNDTTNLDLDYKTLAFQTLQSKVGKLKILPIFAGTDKGRLERIELKNESTYNQEKLNDIRKMIALSVGLPPSLLFGEDLYESKTQMLKQFSRYVRKLTMVQEAMASGIKDLVFAHFVAKGMDKVKRSDIEVKFATLLDVEQLDRIEFIQAVVSTMSDFVSFLATFSEEGAPPVEIDFDVVTQILGHYFNVLLETKGLFKSKGKTTPKVTEGKG